MPAIVLEYVLSKNGLTVGKDVFIDTTIQFAMPGAFIGEPTTSSMEKEGKAYIVASLGKESGEVPYTAYFTILIQINCKFSKITKLQSSTIPRK